MTAQRRPGGKKSVEKAWPGEGPDARHISIAIAANDVLNVGVELLRLEEGLHHIDNAIFAIQHRQNPPLVEGEARVRDVETDHVSRT